MESMTRLFRHRAEQVSAVVEIMPSVDQALAYCTDICHQKEACQLLAAGCEAPLSEPAVELCETKNGKMIAAPDLSTAHREALTKQCQPKGIEVVTSGLRRFLGGIDIGLTWADFGIAETGTVVINSTNEDLRLSTMISEVHVVLLPKDRIVDSAHAIAEPLAAAMAAPANYTAFITGASRTADIERTLALGVHGPLTFHVLIIEDV